MKSDNDGRIGKRPSYFPQRFNPKTDEMMEVNNVRLHIEEIAPERAREIIRSLVRQQRVIIVIRPQERFPRALTQAHQWRLAMPNHGMSSARQIKRFCSRQLIETGEEIVRGHLGPSDGEGRMTMGNNEDPRHVIPKVVAPKPSPVCKPPSMRRPDKIASVRAA